MRHFQTHPLHCCEELNLSPLGFAVCAVSYSPDGMSLAVGGTEGQCRIFSIGTGVCILAIQCNSGPGSVRSVSFSPAGTLLATGAEDGNMSVFGTADGHCKLAMPARTKCYENSIIFLQLYVYTYYNGVRHILCTSVNVE